MSVHLCVTQYEYVKLFDTASKIHLGEVHYKLSRISNFMMYKVNNSDFT